MGYQRPRDSASFMQSDMHYINVKKFIPTAILLGCVHMMLHCPPNPDSTISSKINCGTYIECNSYKLRFCSTKGGELEQSNDSHAKTLNTKDIPAKIRNQH